MEVTRATYKFPEYSAENEMGPLFTGTVREWYYGNIVRWNWHVWMGPYIVQQSEDFMCFMDAREDFEKNFPAAKLDSILDL